MKMPSSLRRIRLWELALTAAVMALPLIPSPVATPGYSFVRSAHAAEPKKLDTSRVVSVGGDVTEIIYALSFAVAVGLAAFGGVVGAELLPVEPYYALRYMVTFLVVVSVGGAGSIPGALIACLVLGGIDTTGRYLMPEFGEFFFYLAVIAIICIFPRGFAGRAK